MNRRQSHGIWKKENPSVPRLAALALALLLPWAGLALAEGDVYFLAAEEMVLPLTDDTMPFWEEDWLYIPCSIFTDAVADGAARRSLDIGLTQNNDQDKVTLYRGRDSLDFEMGVPFAVDPDGEIHYPGAIWRNGRVFVPANLVAAYFGLLYSVVPVEHGNLVWLRSRTFRLRDAAFADAASWQMEQVYEAYTTGGAVPEAGTPVPPDGGRLPEVGRLPDSGQLPDGGRSDTPSGTPTGTPSSTQTETPPEIRTDTPSDTTAPPSSDTTPEIHGGVDLYLCLRAGENTSALLDTLDGAGVRGAFFCDRAFLEQQGDLLRRMTATGHSVGLYLSGEDRTADGLGSAGGTDTADGADASDAAGGTDPSGTAEETGGTDAAGSADTADAAGTSSTADGDSTDTADSGKTTGAEGTSSTADGGSTGTAAGTGGDLSENRHLMEQAAAGGDLLERAACGRTRLVYVQGGTAADRTALRALGYVCLEPSLDFAADIPLSPSRQRALLRAAETLGGSVSVWLGNGGPAPSNSGGSREDGEGGRSGGGTYLGSLLTGIADAGDRVLPLTETAFP